MSQTQEPGTQEYSDIIIHSVFSYNIARQLGGLGRSLLMHCIHEMDNVHDIRAFISSSRCTSEVMLDNLFPWSIAHGLSASHPLRSLPLASTDLVSYFLYLYFTSCIPFPNASTLFCFFLLHQDEFMSYYLDMLTFKNHNIKHILRDVLSTIVSSLNYFL